MLRPQRQYVQLRERREEAQFAGSFAVISFIVLLGDACRGLMNPTLWSLVEGSGGDARWQGAAVASFSIGRVVFSPLLGWLASCVGTKLCLQVSLVLMCLGALVYPVGEDHRVAIIIAQLLLGAGSASLGVCRGWVADRSTPDEKTLRLSKMTALQYAGFTATPIIGSLIIFLFPDQEYEWGYLYTFTCQTIPAYLVLVLAVVGIILLQKHVTDDKRGGGAGSCSLLDDGEEGDDNEDGVLLPDKEHSGSSSSGGGGGGDSSGGNDKGMVAHPDNMNGRVEERVLQLPPSPPPSLASRSQSMSPSVPYTATALRLRGDAESGGVMTAATASNSMVAPAYDGSCSSCGSSRQGSSRLGVEVEMVPVTLHRCEGCDGDGGGDEARCAKRGGGGAAGGGSDGGLEVELGLSDLDPGLREEADRSEKGLAPVIREEGDGGGGDGGGNEVLLMVGLLMLNVVTRGAVSVVDTLGVMVAVDSFGIYDGVNGAIAGVLGAIGVLTLLGMPRLSRYFSDQAFMVVGLIGMVISTIVISGVLVLQGTPSTTTTTTTSSHMVVLYYLGVCVMYSFAFPVCSTAVLVCFSKAAGSASQSVILSWYGSAGSIARIVFPLFGAFVANKYGSGFTFGVVTVLQSVTLVLLVVALRRSSLSAL